MCDALKFVVIGDSHIGKSALTIRYKFDTFSENYELTIGIDFICLNAIIDDNEILTNESSTSNNSSTYVQIWDTAGSERFRSITSAYYRGSHGFLVVYDITNKKSFDNIPYWIDQIKKFGPTDSVIFLVGNKSDNELCRIITYDEGLEKSILYECEFFETSAKNGSNVNLLFETCIRKGYNKLKSSKTVSLQKVDATCATCGC